MFVLKELVFNLSRYCFLCILQMLNKEHEKAEDSKPVAVPTAAGS